MSEKRKQTSGLRLPFVALAALFFGVPGLAFIAVGITALIAEDVGALAVVGLLAGIGLGVGLVALTLGVIRLWWNERSRLEAYHASSDLPRD